MKKNIIFIFLILNTITIFTESIGNCNNGYGRKDFPDGSTYEGHWYHNALDGLGIYTDANGKVYFGIFSNNKYLGDIQSIEKNAKEAIKIFSNRVNSINSQSTKYGDLMTSYKFTYEYIQADNFYEFRIKQYQNAVSKLNYNFIERPYKYTEIESKTYSFSDLSLLENKYVDEVPFESFMRKSGNSKDNTKTISSINKFYFYINDNLRTYYFNKNESEDFVKKYNKAVNLSQKYTLALENKLILEDVTKLRAKLKEHISFTQYKIYRMKEMKSNKEIAEITVINDLENSLNAKILNSSDNFNYYDNLEKNYKYNHKILTPQKSYSTVFNKGSSFSCSIYGTDSYKIFINSYNNSSINELSNSYYISEGNKVIYLSEIIDSYDKR